VRITGLRGTTWHCAPRWADSAYTRSDAVRPRNRLLPLPRRGGAFGIGLCLLVPPSTATATGAREPFRVTEAALYCGKVETRASYSDQFALMHLRAAHTSCRTAVRVGYATIERFCPSAPTVKGQQGLDCARLRAVPYLATTPFRASGGRVGYRLNSKSLAAGKPRTARVCRWVGQRGPLRTPRAADLTGSRGSVPRTISRYLTRDLATSASPVPSRRYASGRSSCRTRASGMCTLQPLVDGAAADRGFTVAAST